MVVLSKHSNITKVVHPKHTYSNITKGLLDKRSYHGLYLENGMKVLLISEPGVVKAAAAMDVNVGHLSDPSELPGLAHFCEHMLFLGTEKYPEEGKYLEYLKEHGGQRDAETHGDHTIFCFDVSAEYLDDTLDRFIEFFKTPLFNASATEREVLAVNSEYSNALTTDTWRLQEVERSLSKQDHVYKKFCMGNKDTLWNDAKEKGLDVREELMKFHKSHYSSNLMGFTVLGKEPLDDLVKMVCTRLSAIENKNLTSPEWTDHPYGKEETGKLVKVVPLMDLRQLLVKFPIPDHHRYYKCKPEYYFAYLVGDQGPGSILSELKRHGWVNSLVFLPSAGAKGFGFLVFMAELTAEGEDHVDDILLVLFQYLAILREAGPQEWFHREVAQISEIDFRFIDMEEPQPYLKRLAENVRRYPMDEVVRGPYLVTEYNPDAINIFMNLLVPENMLVQVVSKSFEGKTDKKEPWFQADYSIESISEDVMKRLANPGKNEALSFPARNEFIPSDFELRPRDDANGPLSELIGPLPELIKNDPLIRIWYLQDKEYLLPKCCINIKLTSPYAYLDPLHESLKQLFAECLSDSLTEYKCAAERAGLTCKVSASKHSLNLSISGYNEKQSVLLEKLMAKVTSFKPDPQRFAQLKDTHVRELMNNDMKQPHKLAVYYMYLILTEQQWSVPEQLKAAEALTVERLEAFIPQFLSSLHIETLVYGNATKQDALNLVGIVERGFEKLGTRPLFPSQMAISRDVKLTEGEHYWIHESESEAHENSCVELLLQTGYETSKNHMLTDIFMQMVEEPLFNQLRTVEQLGYIVWSLKAVLSGSVAAVVIVQSALDPEYVDSRIEAVIQSMQGVIKKMSPAEWERYKDAVEAKLLKKPKTIDANAEKIQKEITGNRYNFDRNNVDIEALKTITKEEFSNFYKDVISADGKLRKKLSLWVVGTAAKKARDEKSGGKGDKPAKAKYIKDIAEFKSKMPLYPAVSPFKPLSEFPIRS